MSFCGGRGFVFNFVIYKFFKKNANSEKKMHIHASFLAKFLPHYFEAFIRFPLSYCRFCLCRILFTDGPSFNKLYANDQILKVNGMDVRDSPQVDVISLIKYVVIVFRFQK